jgi:hypothetical protein
MRGLWKIHHAIQTRQAREDWQRLAEKAREQGQGDLAEQYQPKEGAGWRTIDWHAARLDRALRALGVESGLDYSHVDTLS